MLRHAEKAVGLPFRSSSQQWPSMPLHPLFDSGWVWVWVWRVGPGSPFLVSAGYAERVYLASESDYFSSATLIDWFRTSDGIGKEYGLGFGEHVACRNGHFG